MTLEVVSDHNWTGGLVTGVWYTAQFTNTSFRFWSSRRLNRREARQAALDFANGGYHCESYGPTDLESVRAERKKR